MRVFRYWRRLFPPFRYKRFKGRRMGYTLQTKAERAAERLELLRVGISYKLHPINLIPTS